MRTVELFAGIGGFRLAADRLGHRTVWSNDLAPDACAVYRDRFGTDALVEGDFTTLVDRVPEHDLLTGGFPCQPFSSAGKKRGVRDARGTLFESIVAVLERRRPQVFVLENVKRLLSMERGRHFATILGALAELDYDVEWRLVNAMHLGLPQNRERVVIVGVRDGSPRVRLGDAGDFESLSDRRRSLVADPTRWPAIEEHRVRFPKWGLARDGRFVGADPETFGDARPLITLDAVLEPAVADTFDFTEATLAWVHENTPVNRFVNGVEILSNQRGGARMGYTIFGTNGVAPTLTSTTSRHYERYRVGDRYRRLTNVEYARIQGFPDDHCRAVSVYDQYALFGNAVPPPLAEWALQRATGDGWPIEDALSGRIASSHSDVRVNAS